MKLMYYNFCSDSDETNSLNEFPYPWSVVMKNKLSRFIFVKLKFHLTERKSLNWVHLQQLAGFFSSSLHTITATRIDDWRNK